MQTRTKQRIYDKFIEDRVIDELLTACNLAFSHFSNTRSEWNNIFSSSP